MRGRIGINQFAAITAGTLLLLLAVSLEAKGQAAAMVAHVTAASPRSAAQSPTQSPNDSQTTALGRLFVHPNVAQSSLAAYIDRVTTETATTRPTDGSIWTESGRFTRLSADVRARRPNDLISVVVSENLAASTAGTVKNSRKSSANSQVSALFGALHVGNALQDLVNQSSAAGLNAQGASATNSSLQTVFGGQVVDVLPNGMLVIEAARQVEFSQQTQTIVLRGLVRPEDISQQNQVLSTAISSLELEVRGKGIINDYTRRPNMLVRLLEKVVVF
jgi:flagellar L-ring protein precursor FlgH